jgi:sugar lactone lactonase YvrE
MNAKVVLDGLVLGESPRWHNGRLWVADWAAHELITLDAGGTRQVAERPTSIPCCIDWLPDGRLLLVSGDRLLRREPDGTMVTHAASCVHMPERGGSSREVEQYCLRPVSQSAKRSTVAEMPPPQ